MAGFADMTLRTLSFAPMTTVARELTWSEMDTNWIRLAESINLLGTPGTSLAPWNSGTTYSADEYVSYSGNMYRSITTTTGDQPDTSPAQWELTSVGALAHPVNRDQFLDEGGPSEVSASQVVNLFTAMTDKVLPVWNSTAKQYQDSILRQDSSGTYPALILDDNANGFEWKILGTSNYVHRLMNIGGGETAIQDRFVPTGVASPLDVAIVQAAYGSWGVNHYLNSLSGYRYNLRAIQSYVEVFHTDAITLASSLVLIYAQSGISSAYGGIADVQIDQNGVTFNEGKLLTLAEVTPGSSWMGSATLSGGSATVQLPGDPASVRIFITCQALGTVTSAKAMTIANIDSINNRFDIVSEDATDTSTVAFVCFGKNL